LSIANKPVAGAAPNVENQVEIDQIHRHVKNDRATGARSINVLGISVVLLGLTQNVIFAVCDKICSSM